MRFGLRVGVLACVLALFSTCPAFAGNITLSGATTTDNEFWAYISTDDSVAGTQVGYGNNWGATYNFTTALTPGVTNYLHIYGLNWGGPASFIGEFTLYDPNFKFANGTSSLLTNTTDWKVSATGFGTGYVAPTSWGINGVSPWYFHPDISSSAQWIWTAEYEGEIAYFSTALTPTTPVPLPTAAWTGLTLLAGVGGVKGLKRLLRQKA